MGAVGVGIPNPPQQEKAAAIIGAALAWDLEILGSPQTLCYHSFIALSRP